jgi:hypothetical protein
LEGRWKLLSATKRDGHIYPAAGHTSEEPKEIVMTVQTERGEDRDRLLVSLRVYNTIRLAMDVVSTGPDEKSVDVSSNGRHPASTMMMPPSPYNVVEQELSKCLVDDWQSFRLEGDGVLFVTTSANHSMAHFERLVNDDATTPALNKYHH